MNVARTDDFLIKNPTLKKFFHTLNSKQKACIEKIIFIGQADIFKNINSLKTLKKIAEQLVQVDSFFNDGIVGYHNTFLSLLKEKKIKKHFLKPYPVDISKKNKIEGYIQKGLENLDRIAEIYPIGGAGDRLKLIDPKTKSPLPVACLPFLKKSLLELLILDLQAREHLYYQTFNKKVNTPVVLMTSEINNNYDNILNLLEDHNYFQRPKDSFFIFKQLMVPVIDEKGNWVVEDFRLKFKPGGHGMLWQLMKEHKVFEWLYERNRKFAIVRQINNPLAAVDYNLLAFSGYGISCRKKFGFFGCERKKNAQEGVIVLQEKKVEKGFVYCNTNIEYINSVQGECYPANTNTLFVDLQEVEKVLNDKKINFIINLKNFHVVDNKKIKCGRLESMMQDIADEMVDCYNTKIKKEEKKDLGTFIIFNKRIKTISATKKNENKNNFETPQKAYLDLLKNYKSILKKSNIKFDDLHCYLSPMLGPMYEDITKKINKGIIKPFSELILDIADLYIKNIYLKGSLIIQGKGLFELSPTCILEDVKIANKGIDYSKNNVFYKGEIYRKESLNIILHENSMIEAKGVILTSGEIIVEKNSKLQIYTHSGKTIFKKSLK